MEKNCPDVLKPTCIALDGINSGRFKAFSHIGFINHSPPPSYLQEFSLLIFMSYVSFAVTYFFLDLFACKILPDHSPRAPWPARPASSHNWCWGDSTSAADCKRGLELRPVTGKT